MQSANDLAALLAEREPEGDFLQWVADFLGKDRERLSYRPDDNFIWLSARPAVIEAAQADAVVAEGEQPEPIMLGRQVSGEWLDLMMRSLAGEGAP